FAGEPLMFIPPAKGSRHLLRMIREILMARPTKRGTSIEDACNVLIKSLKRKSLVFMISDFQATVLDKPLGKLVSKHETVCLRVIDPVEQNLPRVGKVVLIDPESGIETAVNTNNRSLGMAYKQLTHRQSEEVASVFKKHGIDTTDLSTDSDALPALHLLLKRRGKRRK
ncbi:MAG: DUF58 domain-containing protein, partial [Akkermansiaceae bacterium]